MRNDLPKEDPLPALEVALDVLDFSPCVAQRLADELERSPPLERPVLQGLVVGVFPDGPGVFLPEFGSVHVFVFYLWREGRRESWLYNRVY